MNIRTHLFIGLMLLGLLVACGGTGESGGDVTSPGNVTATAGPGYITVTWKDRSEDETGFVIYRSAASENAVSPQADTNVGEVAADVETFVDTEVELEQNYLYHVTAKTSQGESKKVAASQTERVERGVDLMVGTNARRDGNGTGTVFVIYYVLPEAVLDDKELEFDLEIVGPDGWNDGEDIGFSLAPGNSARKNKFSFVSFFSIDAVAGTYNVSLDVGKDKYTAVAALKDADFRLSPPTDITVSEHSSSSVRFNWNAPPTSKSSYVALWRGDYEELIVNYRRTGETMYTFDELDLEDGTYQVEVAPVNIDVANYPIKTESLGLSYETQSFIVESVNNQY